MVTDFPEPVVPTAVPPAAPALANAIYDAVGVRIEGRLIGELGLWVFEQACEQLREAFG